MEQELREQAAESKDELVLRLLDVAERLDRDWDGPSPRDAQLARGLLRLVDGRVRRLRAAINDLVAQQALDLITPDIVEFLTTGLVRYREAE